MHTEPWNEDLLDYLANYLVEHDYDLKAVLRLIATSQIYAAESVPAEDAATSAEFVFKGPQARHLTSEQFMDSVRALTDTWPRAIQAPVPTAMYYGENLPDAGRAGKWIWNYADTKASPAGERVFLGKQPGGSRVQKKWF